ANLHPFSEDETVLTLKRMVLTAGCAAAVMSLALAQPPGGRPGDAPAKDKDRPTSAGANSIVERMMAFDKNKDGKLTRDEITDERLLRLFDRADANKDGVVTREELVALATKMLADQGAGGQRGGPPGEGPGGPGGRGPGGPGGRGPGGFGGPPQPGQILPMFVQDQLNLTAEQKKQVEAIQKEVE